MCRSSPCNMLMAAGLVASVVVDIGYGLAIDSRLRGAPVLPHTFDNNENSVSLENAGDEGISGNNLKEESIHRCTLDEIKAIKGFLIDLDGTMYYPGGLLPGAVEFFDYLEGNDVPYVLLSNGFKTKQGVASKFAMDKYKINHIVDPVNKVHTAGVAIARYMTDHVPKGAKLFCIGTGIEYQDKTKDSIMRILSSEVPKELFDSWEVRTDMTLDELSEWANLALNDGLYTAVVQAFMGVPNDKFGDDPVTYRIGYSTFDYDLMKKVNVILRNKGHYIVGGPDVADSQPKHDKFPSIDTSWPTMGGIESLFLTSAEMWPGSEKEKQYHINTGKGGNRGSEYMMKPGIAMLQKQKPDITPDQIMMIGDNFGTDILAGNQAGVQTMLVLVGAHKLEDKNNWSSSPTCYLDDVGDIVTMMTTSEVSDADETSK